MKQKLGKLKFSEQGKEVRSLKKSSATRIKEAHPSPRIDIGNDLKHKKKGLLGATNSAAKFAQTDTNNFTLGATNINVFTLSPRAFSSSIISSLSKELLSNISSGQKN